MQMPGGRASRDPLTIPGRESVEGAGLGTEPEVPVVAGRSAEGERPGLSGAVSWPVLFKTTARPRVQGAQAGLGRGTHFCLIT